MLNDFIATIAAPQYEHTADVFWPEMASSLALANLLLLMECGQPDEINLASLASMCGIGNEEYLGKISEKMDADSLAAINYQGVFSAGERTKPGIYVTLFSMVRIFNIQKNLTAMLSGNTFDIRSIGRRKTAVYVIVPDEKTTYHFLVTTFIKQVYETLIVVAQKTPKRSLPIRVNFVLDEFCNIPKIPDMPSMISAARSRNMRFYLVVQSLHQLKGRYGADADTIKGIYDNWVFLTSKELALLNEISELCGTVCAEDQRSRRLISVSELQRLDKEKGEALIMHARQYPIISEIADIDMYAMYHGYPAAKMKKFDIPTMQIFSVQKLFMDVAKGRKQIPFCSDRKIDKLVEDELDEEIYDRLQTKLDKLLNALSSEE